MNKIIKEYINQHNILNSEYLFSDWNEFLNVLYKNNGKIEAVLWYEHILIDRQKGSLGSGGYRDKNDPDYMYAETQIYNDGLKNKSAEEIVTYIQSVINEYPNNSLIPSFFIAE